MYKEALNEMIVKLDLKEKGIPLVVTKEMTEEQAKGLVIKAIAVLNETDFFTKETTEALKELGWDRTKLEKVVEETPEEILEEPDPLNMIDIVKTSTKLRELKDICQSEPEFKSIRGKLSSYKDAESLKREMVDLLSPPVFDPIPEYESTLNKLVKKIDEQPVLVIREEPVVEEVEEEPESVVEEKPKEPKVPLGPPPPTNLPKLVKKHLRKKMEKPLVEYMNPKELITKPPFSNLFTINKDILSAITASMEESGFDKAYPIIIWNKTVIDGHTRLVSALTNGIELVPILEKDFDEEKDALQYAIHNQRDRRNISEIDLLKCISVLDTPMSKTDAGAKGGRGEEERILPTHKVTAKILNIGESKVTDARVVLKNADAVKEVEGGATIRDAAKKIRDSKKKPKEAIIAKMTRVESVLKLLKENAGGKVPRGAIIEESNNIYILNKGEDGLTEAEETTRVVLEVLSWLRMVKIMDDMVFIKKTVK